VVAKTAETASIALPAGEPLVGLPRSPVARSRSASIPVAVRLVGIIAAATAVRVVIASQTPVPWLVPDELIYSGLARSFAATGHFAVRGHPFSPWGYGPLYPVLIAPAFRLANSMPQAYFIVRAMNAVVMSSAAVPAFFLARRLLDRRTALLAATFAIFIPSATYTVRLGTESLAYPAFLWAALAVISVLERPGSRRELVALAAIAFAVLTRAQLMVLFPAFVVSALLVPRPGEAAHRDRPFLGAVASRLGAYRLTSLSILGLLAALIVTLTTGHSFASLLGGRAEAVGSADLLAVAKSAFLHLAALDLYLAVLPLAALLVLCGQAMSRAAARELRVFCVFAVTVSLLLAVESARYLVAVFEGPFSSQGSYLRVYDRYEFYVVPLFVIALLVWVRQGLPRPKWTAAIAVLSAGVVPFSFAWGGKTWTQPDSLVFLPWDYLRLIAGTSALVYGLLVPASAYLAYVFFRSRNVDWMVFLIAVNFLVLGIFGQAVAYGDSRTALRQGIGAGIDRDWIDRRVGPDAQVIALWSGFERRGVHGWRALWESELMNQSVRGIYDLREPLPLGLPGQAVHLQGGRLETGGRLLRARYVLTDVDTPVLGTKVASDRRVGLVVYRVDGPVQLRQP
jgi:Dolichyl-phosphate-mannose-protein mannosyltransferase